MNKLNHFLTAALITLFFNSFAGNYAALSGVYTIGKSQSADFSSVAQAATAVENGGVSGPVTFRIESGNYYERVVMSTIPGASATNKVTFESTSGYNTDVTISYASSNATFIMNGTSHVSFQNITINHRSSTYGNAVRVDGKPTDMHFSNVIFNGVEAPRTGANSATVYFTSSAPKSDISFEDCEINNGSMGIAKSGMNTENPDNGTIIKGTQFSNQFETAIALSNENAPAINNNVINSLSNFSNFKGISLQNISNNAVINNNVITMAQGSTGIEMYNCKAEAGNMGQITGNTVSVGGNDEANGIALIGNTDNQTLNLNSIKLNKGAETINQAFYRNTGTGNNIDINNNICYDFSTGRYTVVGVAYKGSFNQIPAQSSTSMAGPVNRIATEKTTAAGI